MLLYCGKTHSNQCLPYRNPIAIFGFEKISLEKQFESIYKQKKEVSRSIKRQQTAKKKTFSPRNWRRGKKR